MVAEQVRSGLQFDDYCQLEIQFSELVNILNVGDWGAENIWNFFKNRVDITLVSVLFIR